MIAEGDTLSPSGKGDNLSPLRALRSRTVAA